MHARVTTTKGEATGEQARNFVRDTILPQARSIEGFKGVLDLVDPSTGNGLTVTLWEDEAAMKASEDAASGMRNAAAEELGGEVVEVRRFEVATIEI